MDRCTLANAYHEKGFNCAQSVLAAFGDLTALDERQALAVAGGMGGGVGGSRQEICGALSGAVLALGLLLPHTEEDDSASKRRVYDAASELRRRFLARFSSTCCGELVKGEIVPSAGSAAERLNIGKPCAVLIVTAVELTEKYLREIGIAC